MPAFSTKTRGMYRTLYVDGQPVRLQVTGVLHTPPHQVDGKTYATITASDPMLGAVDAEIRRLVAPNASPLLGEHLVVKILPRALQEADMKPGDAVIAHLALGAFGKFGYCWVASAFVNPWPV